MAGGLAADLFDLGAQRRVEAMRKGWPEVPPWVFCSDAGGTSGTLNVPGLA